MTAIALMGASAVQDYSYFILLGAAAVSLVIGLLASDRRRCIVPGLVKTGRQILPAIPILIFIGSLSATWMLSGVVPALIDYGLELIAPNTFLVVACLTCAVVSVVRGGSGTR